jgi:alanine racemase
MYLKDLRPAWAEVDLDILAQNFREIKRATRSGTLIMAVVKGNAYGHGAITASKTFVDNGAEMLGVATVTEGVELRQSGIDAPILNLGYTPENQYDLLLGNNISATIYSYSQAKSLNNAAASKAKKLEIHIKLDTGLGRIGFLPDEDTIETIAKISMLPNLHVEGIYTHFAEADQLDKTYTRTQYEIFTQIIDKLENRNIEIPLKHVSNSAAIIDLPEYDLDMVRPGMILYGYKPYREEELGDLTIKPALTLKARLSNIKKVPAGIGIGYGLTFRTQKTSTIGTVPLGYADGFMRQLSNKGWIGVKGKKASIVGRICMDQFMVDLTNHFNSEIGDEVVIFGGNGAQTAEDMAEIIGTEVDEVICSISRRVPRVYVKGGEVVEVKDYLLNN